MLRDIGVMVEWQQLKTRTGTPPMQLRGVLPTRLVRHSIWMWGGITEAWKRWRKGL